MDSIHRLRDRVTPPARWRFPLTALACLLSGLVWAILTRLVEAQSLRLTLAAFAALRLWLTALFLGLLTAAAVLLTHSLFAGNLLLGAPVLLLAFADHFKRLITSIPLTLGDLSLAGQVGHIAALNSRSLTLNGNSVLALLGAALWLLAALFFSRPLRSRWGWAIPGVPAAALTLVLIFWMGADRLVYRPLGAGLEQSLPPLQVHQTCGPILGIWRELLLRGQPEENYGQAHMEQVLAEAEDFAGSSAGKSRQALPNVILILSESFFDVTELEGVSFEEDPLAGFHTLQHEGVSGKFYTRTLGYGTCNIELEVLTGVNPTFTTPTDLVSWRPDLFARLPAVPALLRDNGYRTVMVHTYDDSVYHRADFLPRLGFQNFYFSGDLARIYPPAVQAESSWDYMLSRIQGIYYSDDLLTDVLISQYEQLLAQEDGPLFLYGVSMENHSPYVSKYSEEERTVVPRSSLSGEAADSLLNLSQGLADASTALLKLTDYLRGREEPTVVVFFGDHRPGLGLSGGGSVWSELGLVEADSAQWTLEDYLGLYCTDYLIWSNDPACLPGAPGSAADTSCNYLGVLLLKAAGVELPLYWRLLSRLSQSRLVDTAAIHIGTDGILTETAPDGGPAGRGLALIRDLLYDTFHGNQYAAGALRRPRRSRKTRRDPHEKSA